MTLRPQLLFLCLSLIPGLFLKNGEASEPPSVMYIAKYSGDKTAALSFTFDDNLRNQEDFAVPLLEKYGIHATFFVIPGKTPETMEEASKMKVSDHGSIPWESLRKIAAAGHEIGNHSWSHLPLRQCDDSTLEAEVVKGYEAIRDKIGVAPLSFCYPGNGTDDRVRAAAMKLHVAAREKNTERFGSWPPTNKDFTAAKANQTLDHYIAKGGALVWMIHAITDGYNALSGPEVLEHHMQHAKSREDVLWIDTFAHVSLYAQERDNAKLTQRISGDRASFSLECPLDTQTFDLPLTIVIPVTNASNAEARLRKSKVPVPVELRPDRILVRARPSSEEIEVVWKNH